MDGAGSKYRFSWSGLWLWGPTGSKAKADLCVCSYDSGCWCICTPAFMALTVCSPPGSLLSWLCVASYRQCTFCLSLHLPWQPHLVTQAPPLSSLLWAGFGSGQVRPAPASSSLCLRALASRLPYSAPVGPVPTGVGSAPAVPGPWNWSALLTSGLPSGTVPRGSETGPTWAPSSRK